MTNEKRQAKFGKAMKVAHQRVQDKLETKKRTVKVEKYAPKGAYARLLKIELNKALKEEGVKSTRKAPAKKANARKATVKKTTGRKTTARKTTARKTTARKAPAKKKSFFQKIFG